MIKKVAIIDEAVIIDDYLVISDLQIGCVNIPTFHERTMIKRLIEINSKAGSEKLIINGDVKHDFGKPTLNQVQRVRNFFKKISKEFKQIIIIKGNHDTYLETILKNYDIKNFFETNNFFITHGHEKYDTNKNLILGHEHPALQVRDESGKLHNYKCHLVGEKLLITPAFSTLTIGTPVNKHWKPMSPMIKNPEQLRPVINDLIFPPLKELE